MSAMIPAPAHGRPTSPLRRALAVLAAAMALAGCGESIDRGDAPEEIGFSVATGGPGPDESHWEPVLREMEAAIGMPVRPRFDADPDDLVEALREGRTDVGRFSNQSALEAVGDAGGQVFARTIDPAGVDGYYSVLVVRKGRRITLDDVLRCEGSLSIGLGEADSLPDRLAPMTYLFAPRGIDPQDCFSNVRADSARDNLSAVARGRLDVAASDTTAMRRVRGGALAERVEVIWRSPVLPEDALVYRRDLDPAVKEKLRQFFLTYGQGQGPEAERERRNLAALSIGGFRPADDAYLLPVREMEAAQTLLEARGRGRTEAIAEAEKALGDVRQRRIEEAGRAGDPNLVP